MSDYEDLEEQRKRIAEEEKKARDKALIILRKVLLGSKDGLKVLDYLLTIMGHWSQAVTPGDTVCKNLAIDILVDLGIYTNKNTKAIIDNFAKLPNRE